MRGRAGQSQGVVEVPVRATSKSTVQASGPSPAVAPPTRAAQSSPAPVSPATLRATAAVPPGRSAPTDAARRTPTATAVTTSTVSSRSHGSRRPRRVSGEQLPQRTVIALRHQGDQLVVVHHHVYCTPDTPGRSGSPGPGTERFRTPRRPRR
ncbi:MULTISPECIES: hypothetical protein [unclassified Streptomyces]|uniref:hypothetical protein n=1 Tax=unclassified Streptomyces TaxID=2593676 RepID=UPI002E2E26B7|nr:hypothetical protein [Streptomyces sp. NBC_00223]